MLWSSFKVTFPECRKTLNSRFAYDTFFNALVHIGLRRVSELQTKGCKPRVTRKIRKWSRSRTARMEVSYEVSLAIGNKEKRRYIQKVCDELGIEVCIEL